MKAIKVIQPCTSSELIKFIATPGFKPAHVFRAYDRHRAVTFRIIVAEYEHMRKWMVEFLNKFESRGIKTCQR